MNRPSHKPRGRIIVQNIIRSLECTSRCTTDDNRGWREHRRKPCEMPLHRPSTPPVSQRGQYMRTCLSSGRRTAPFVTPRAVEVAVQEPALDEQLREMQGDEAMDALVELMVSSYF